MPALPVHPDALWTGGPLHMKTVYTRGPPATHNSVLGKNSRAREVSRGQHSGVFPERRRRAGRRWFALTVPVGRKDGGGCGAQQGGGSEEVEGYKGAREGSWMGRRHRAEGAGGPCVQGGRACEWDGLRSELSAPPSSAWCSGSSPAPSLQSWFCRRPWSVSEDYTGSQIRFSPRMTGQFHFGCCKSSVARWALVGGSTNHIKGRRSCPAFISAYA